MSDRQARIVVTAALALALCGTASAQSTGKRTITAGSLECGISGMLTSVDGTLEARGTVRGGTFFDAPSGLWGTEAEISYGHLRSLNQFDVEGNFSYSLAVDAEGLFPYLALAGGVRIEQVGSYRQTLLPAGVNIGLRVLVSEQAGVRVDVKVRRVMNDPVKDFTEVTIAIGLSLFFPP